MLRSPQNKPPPPHPQIAQYNFAAPGWSASTGHFTQVVWRATLRVGCGVKRGCGWDTYVCQYSPPGEQRAGRP